MQRSAPRSPFIHEIEKKEYGEQTKAVAEMLQLNIFVRQAKSPNSKSFGEVKSTASQKIVSTESKLQI
jgi:hypothetical protein